MFRSLICFRFVVEMISFLSRKGCGSFFMACRLIDRRLVRLIKWSLVIFVIILFGMGACFGAIMKVLFRIGGGGRNI